MRRELLRDILSQSLRTDVQWQYASNLAYYVEEGHILTGLYFEKSSRKDQFYVWDVTLPLFVPNETLVLSWSRRLGGGSHTFSLDDTSAIRLAVGEAHSQMPNYEQGLSAIAENVNLSNIRSVEAAAYAKILCAQYEPAKQLLNGIVSSQVDRDWEREIHQRASTMLAHLNKNMFSQAKEQLREWSAFTLRSVTR